MEVVVNATKKVIKMTKTLIKKIEKGTIKTVTCFFCGLTIQGRHLLDKQNPDDHLFTRHHTVPREILGKGKKGHCIWTCRTCQDYLHRLFSNQYLAETPLKQLRQEFNKSKEKIEELRLNTEIKNKLYRGR